MRIEIELPAISPPRLISEAAWFILRGLGIKDEIIAAHRVAEFPGLAAAAQ